MGSIDWENKIAHCIIISGVERERLEPNDNELNLAFSSYLSQPVGIRQRQVGECPLPLDKVPGRAHVVVPRDHPLHRVAHQVDVDRVGQVEPEWN